MLNHYYHSRLSTIYRNIIPPQSRILELGCGNGRLLATLKPSFGVGIDASEEKIEEAKSRLPDLHFVHADAHQFNVDGTFDYIILSDLINDLWDMQGVLEQLHQVSHKRTRIILNNYSRLWELPLWIIHKLGLGKPQIQKNWLTPSDINNFLELAGYQLIKEWQEILMPIKIPLITHLLNRYLAKIWPFNAFTLTNFVLARPYPQNPNRLSLPSSESPLVSIIVPAKDEAGHIPILFDRLPVFEQPIELVFVEGNSSDDTRQVIQQEINNNQQIDCQFHRQSGLGKKNAVEMGIEKARGDIIAILDADLTVAPEDLPRFINTITSGHGDFINGVRMVYPREKGAMRKANLLGNKFFARALSIAMRQRIGDALCGTKVFWKHDYEQFSQNADYLGQYDPFGDFAFLFGAASMNLKIINVPVRYRARTYGDTNIQRWRDGYKLARLLLRGLARLRFT